MDTVTRVRNLFLCVLFFALLASSIGVTVADSCPAKVYIVQTQQPHDEEPKAYYIRTLSAVLGSEEAAKDALLYSYTSTFYGFAAKLAPDQAAQISQQPGVLVVFPDVTAHVHPTCINK